MLDSRSPDSSQRSDRLVGPASRHCVALVAAACFSSLVVLTACSERSDTPSSEVRGATIAATVTAEPVYPAGRLTLSTPPLPVPTPLSLPAVAPTQEPLAPLPESPSPPGEAALPQLPAALTRCRAATPCWLEVSWRRRSPPRRARGTPEGDGQARAESRRAAVGALRRGAASALPRAGVPPSSPGCLHRDVAL